jgi:hypothetical protein
MTNTYIAFHREKGIYLGVMSGFALFSANNLALTYKAIRFESEKEVYDFFKKAVPKVANEIEAIPVYTESKDHVYISVIDIIKSGHKKHVDSLLEHMPTYNETIH